MPVATFAMHRPDLPNLIVRYFFIYRRYKKTERNKKNGGDNMLIPSRSKVKG